MLCIIEHGHKICLYQAYFHIVKCVPFLYNGYSYYDENNYYLTLSCEGKGDDMARWYKLHKYISLVCMVFLLIFCITGLPLIFKNEIKEFNAVHHEPVHAATTEQALWAEGISHLGTMTAQFPYDTIRAIEVTPQLSRVIYHFNDKNGVMPHYTGGSITYYADTGTVKNTDQLEQQVKYPALKELMTAIHLWHVSLNLGPIGMGFLGFMCLFSLIAIISGVVLYGPFMRTTAFGEIKKKSTRSAYLSWHKFLGMVTAVWASLLCVSGMCVLIFGGIYIGYISSAKKEATAKLQPTAQVAQISLTDALARVKQELPHKQVESVDFPNGTNQYIFYLISPGNVTGLTEQIASVSADSSGHMTFYSKPGPAVMPWSSPLIGLHIGNHGTLVLRIIWAILDILTIVMIVVSFFSWRLKNLGAPQKGATKKTTPAKPQSLQAVWKLPALITLLGFVGMVFPMYDMVYAGTAAWVLLLGIGLYAFIRNR